MAGKNLILVTRPAQAIEEFCAALEPEGFETFSEPMLEIVPEDFVCPDLSDYQALIFTSANAVHVFAARCPERDIDVYCVGDNTAEQAREYQFNILYNAKGGGEELASLIVSQKGDGRKFLHIRGAHVAKPIDRMLAAEGVQVDTLVVYRAEKVSELSADCISAIKSSAIEAVTFFSRRTAENFIYLAVNNGLEDDLKNIKALCISERVLEYVRTYAWADTYAAGSPDRKGMLALVKDTCLSNLGNDQDLRSGTS